MPSPFRRSTRAAAPASKPPPPASNTSSSSLSSAKVERTARGSNIGKSATPRSLSSEEPSEPPRRSKRSLAVQDEEAIQDSKEDDQGGGDEEEVTRCICEQQDYPGPPQSEAFTAAEAQSEDAGGLFIQCDGCSVWQHGGCVGIVDESQCPDKYYCEECRPKQHEVRKDSRGQKYSLYLPLHPKVHRKSSTSKHDEKAKRERDSVTSRASTEPGRRRATMRSKEHDDEEEQIMRAIEESKREVESGTSKRGGKRSRDDSEDKHDPKRQRRASESVPALGKTNSLDDESGDESSMPLTVSKAKKVRAEAAMTARNAELREKEIEREKVRAEAAGRRQERAGRRRVDESEPAEDPTTSRPSPPPTSQPSPPPATQSVGKKPGKKTRKLGNNQYTKARELAAQGTNGSPHSKKRQLHAAASGDEQQLANGDGKNSPVQEASNGNGKAKYGKGKNKMINGNKQPEEIEKTIPNMKRALESMHAWIARQQQELAGTETNPGSDGPSPTSFAAGGAVQLPVTSEPAAEREFGSLSATEMAETLSRNIVHWQSLYGGISTQ